jgi:predicted nucleotide-binding protein
MARRPAAPDPVPPTLTIEQKRRRVERLKTCIQDLRDFDPQKVQKRYQIPEVMALEAGIEETLSAAFGHNTPAYNRYSRAASLDNGPHMARGGDWDDGPSNYDAQDAQEARQYLTEGKERSIAMLQQAIRAMEAEIADQSHDVTQAAPATKAPSSGRKVFVVHGKDEAALQAVARFLEQLGLEAIILREQVDAGRTIIEKFEDCAAEVGFAVVLLTPDDLIGETADGATSSRARQNVVFELGYFAGKLGRGRACLMRKGAVEIPSDLHGVIYTELDSAEGWKIKLIKELKAAKLEFDANRMWG